MPDDSDQNGNMNGLVAAQVRICDVGPKKWCQVSPELFLRSANKICGSNPFQSPYLIERGETC